MMDRIIREILPPTINSKVVNIPDLRNNSRLLITDKLSAPPVILKVDESIIGTLGNFSASTGKAKSKKTFNVCAIVAAALSNGTVLNYTANLPQNKRKILYVDTEQSPFHCQKTLVRIFTLAGLPVSRQPQELEFLSLRRYSPKIRLDIIEYAVNNTEGLGLVVIDGIRDLAYDINSPSEATELITKLMQWTDERHLHLHTVLHLNKGDDNTRGHLGTELNNKAETVLQLSKDDIDKDTSIVYPMFCREKEFEPFAFRINEESLPELVEGYQCNQKSKTSRGFDYSEVPEVKHREALEDLFSKDELFSYEELVKKLKESYAKAGYSFGINKAKDLKVFLEKNLMIKKQGKSYGYNPDFKY